MTVSDDALVSYFHRHVVPLLFSFVKGENRQQVVVTAFALSVCDEWYLVTAGHCLKDISEMTKGHGYSLDTCYLIDSPGTDARDHSPLPFAYSIADSFYFSDDLDLDYGLIRLGPYYQQLLARNSVAALDEDAWQRQPAAVDFYMLLGIPSDFVGGELPDLTLGSALLRVHKEDEKPSGFSGGGTPLFYGRLELNSGLKSIRGMSGGPIFAFKQTETGELRYWVTALQSRWLPDSRYIAACPTRLLGESIANVIRGLVEIE